MCKNHSFLSVRFKYSLSKNGQILFISLPSGQEAIRILRNAFIVLFHSLVRLLSIIIQQFFYVRFLIENFGAYLVISNFAVRAVFLKCPS